MKWLAVLMLCSGCFTARYLTQAATGQLALIAAGRPLSSAINDPRTPPHVALLLARVPGVKAFGEAHGLEPTQNYARYADLHRSAAVWVVQACAPLKFESKRWSFPIAGTVPYLGFFDEQAAHAYATQLATDEALDVDVRGASAYSTLGWFKDPVLSTMIPEGPDAQVGLINTVLHESVHATLYIPGQSAFDESLASFVGDKLTAAYLSKRYGADSKQLKAYVEGEQRSAEWISRLHRAWEELNTVYESPALGDDEKRAKKAELLAALKVELGSKRLFNNAVLSGYRTYDTGGPAFERLLHRCDDDLKTFMATVKQLEPSSFPSPQMEDFSPVIDALEPK